MIYSIKGSSMNNYLSPLYSKNRQFKNPIQQKLQTDIVELSEAGAMRAKLNKLSKAEHLDEEKLNNIKYANQTLGIEHYILNEISGTLEDAINYCSNLSEDHEQYVKDVITDAVNKNEEMYREGLKRVYLSVNEQACKDAANEAKPYQSPITLQMILNEGDFPNNSIKLDDIKNQFEKNMEDPEYIEKMYNSFKQRTFNDYIQKVNNLANLYNDFYNKYIGSNENTMSLINQSSDALKTKDLIDSFFIGAVNSISLENTGNIEDLSEQCKNALKVINNMDSQLILLADRIVDNIKNIDEGFWTQVQEQRNLQNSRFARLIK